MIDSGVMLQIVASLTDDSRGVIYNCNMFILHATEVLVPGKPLQPSLMLVRPEITHMGYISGVNSLK